MLSNEKLRILVTGSNGFVGSNLIKRLCELDNVIIKAMVLKGTSIKLLENYQTLYNTENNDNKKLEIIYANLLDIESLKEAVKNIDVVIHLAGLVTDWAPKDKFRSIIVDGTKNLLNAIDAVNPNLKRIIFMSSLTVHNMNGHHFDDESAPRDMKFFYYGICKRECEDMISEWVKKRNNCDYALIRPGFIIYGPNDVGSFIRALDGIITGKFGFINGGKSLISYVYVENLVEGIVLLLNANKIDGPYIIVDGNATWKDFITAWAQAADVELPKLNTPYWLIFIPIWLLEKLYKLFKLKKGPILTLYNIRIPRKDLAFVGKKMEEELGYKPKFSFNETISRTLRYYFEEYKKEMK